MHLCRASKNTALEKNHTTMKSDDPTIRFLLRTCPFGALTEYTGPSYTGLDESILLERSTEGQPCVRCRGVNQLHDTAAIFGIWDRGADNS